MWRPPIPCSGNRKRYLSKKVPVCEPFVHVESEILWPPRLKVTIMGCKHDWVHRTDGYEEQCTPAICRICGAYGCLCSIGHPLTQQAYDDFIRRGIPGNSHEIERRLRHAGD